jgi:hypothetical protein
MGEGVVGVGVGRERMEGWRGEGSLGVVTVTAAVRDAGGHAGGGCGAAGCGGTVGHLLTVTVHHFRRRLRRTSCIRSGLTTTTWECGA